jgi:DNA-binding transcriptional ArsR family regulator
MSKRRIEQNLAGAALLFAALGDPTRLTLLQRLSDDGPASISMLAESFRLMTRQGVTKHLQVLAAAESLMAVVRAASRSGRSTRPGSRKAGGVSRSSRVDGTMPCPV